jgi:hypothetical protein
MEIYSSTTRFALACNNSTKIIEPIQSRCAVLRYTKLMDSEVRASTQWVIVVSYIVINEYSCMDIYINVYVMHICLIDTCKTSANMCFREYFI